MEQDTGVEPAFTAWEAVVLPIYESCISEGIIAKSVGKFNLFLSALSELMKMERAITRSADHSYLQFSRSQSRT